jgi:16S rRNA (guanine527-N7)-methyltransferase
MSAVEELGGFAASLGVPLSAQALQKAQDYIELVWAFNQKTNVTAETDKDAFYLRHLADGFPAAAFLRKLTPAAARIADLGSGGGFIGFGLKLAWPEAEVTLIEAVQRKYDFLNEAAFKSGLKGLRVRKARAGKDDAGRYDAVVERAQAQLPDALDTAAPLVERGGLFIAYQSEPPALRERAGLRFLDIMPYTLPRESKVRHLAAYRKED